MDWGVSLVGCQAHRHLRPEQTTLVPTEKLKRNNYTASASISVNTILGNLKQNVPILEATYALPMFEGCLVRDHHQADKV